MGCNASLCRKTIPHFRSTSGERRSSQGGVSGSSAKEERAAGFFQALLEGRNERMRSPSWLLLRNGKTWVEYLTRTKIHSICIHALPTTSAAGKHKVLLGSLTRPGQNLITRNTELAGTLQVACSRHLLLKMRKLIKHLLSTYFKPGTVRVLGPKGGN